MGVVGSYEGGGASDFSNLVKVDVSTVSDLAGREIVTLSLTYEEIMNNNQSLYFILNATQLETIGSACQYPYILVEKLLDAEGYYLRFAAAVPKTDDFEYVTHVSAAATEDSGSALVQISFS